MRSSRHKQRSAASSAAQEPAVPFAWRLLVRAAPGHRVRPLAARTEVVQHHDRSPEGWPAGRPPEAHPRHTPAQGGLPHLGRGLEQKGRAAVSPTPTHTELPFRPAAAACLNLEEKGLHSVSAASSQHTPTPTHTESSPPFRLCGQSLRKIVGGASSGRKCRIEA